MSLLLSIKVFFKIYIEQFFKFFDIEIKQAF